MKRWYTMVINQILLSVLSIVIALTASLAPAAEPGLKQKMDDATGRGYTAIVENNRAEAQEWFDKAGKYALTAGYWQGCMDAGYGLASLGEFPKAEHHINSAFKLAKQKETWHGCVAAGYGYASLPENPERLGLSQQAFMFATEIAEKQGDWRGLIEAGNGYLHVNDQDKAVDVFTLAKSIIDKDRDAEGYTALAQCYEKIGFFDDAQQCQTLAAQHAGNRSENEAVPPPPPGWNPAGETVAGPREIDMAAGAAIRASADAQIAAKHQWTAEQEQLALEQRRLYYHYQPYYYFPFAHPGTDYVIADFGRGGFGHVTIPPAQLHRWAGHHLGYYRYVNGYYIRIDVD